MACKALSFSYPNFFDAHTPVTPFLANYTADFKLWPVPLRVCLSPRFPTPRGPMKGLPIREPHG